jgi:hypothetical protein
MQSVKLKQRESRRGTGWYIRFRLPRLRSHDKRRECWYPLGLVGELNRDDAQRQANDIVAKATLQDDAAEEWGIRSVIKSMVSPLSRPINT